MQPGTAMSFFNFYTLVFWTPLVDSGGQAVGLEGPRGSKGRPTGFQAVRGWPCRVPGDQRVGFQGPRGSTGRFDGSSND